MLKYSRKLTSRYRIRNPLAGIPRHALLANVDEFARQHQLEEHTLLLRKGALVAQNPAAFESINGEEALTQTEKDILVQEVEYKWRVPRLLYLTIITCSIGAAVQGWDQEGSNGANLSFPDVFGIGSDSDHDTYIVGLINSAPYISSWYVSGHLLTLFDYNGSRANEPSQLHWLLAVRSPE